MIPSIFLSYSSKDQAIAETVCNALENRGLTCWMSSRDIGPGENFQVSIIRAIRSASVMVMVFSGNSNNSDEVKKEIALAGQHKLLVVPVRVEDVVPAEAFQYELATRQWIDLFENWEHAIERLASQIRSVIQTIPPKDLTAETALPDQPDETLEAPKQAAPKQAAPKQTAMAPIPATGRAQRSSVWPAVLGVAVLVALSAGGVGWWKMRGQSKDNDAWAAAGQQNSAAGYQGYLQAEPEGLHAAEANLRIDELDWKGAVNQNTVAGYQTYKQIEAQGRHDADADAQIAALNAAAKAAAKAAADQAAAAAQQAAANAQKATANAQRATTQEAADFKKALELHSSAEYRNYLLAHADSSHAAEIRERLASCQMVRTGPILQRLRPQATEERCR
jgi:hypothetical protein